MTTQLSHLEANNLSIVVGNRTLIQNLSFSVSNPSFIAIIGHNGCGKSTFLRSIVNQQEYSGQLLLNKLDVKSQSSLIKDGHVTLLAQKNAVNFSIKVLDLVLMGRFRFKKLFQNYSEVDLNMAKEALALLSIEHLQDKDFLELSGGEQQLVWLAQVILQDTDIVLLDEPSQQLDVYNRKKIFEYMQLMAYGKNKIVFCITHDLTNLKDMKGFILNLSRTLPSLIPISSKLIEEEIAYLESKNHSR